MSDISQNVRLERVKARAQEVLDEMPKVYFVKDDYNGGYRVGRTDWPGDAFNMVPKADFEVFQRVYKGLSMPLIDKTHDED